MRVTKNKKPLFTVFVVELKRRFSQQTLDGFGGGLI